MQFKGYKYIVTEASVFFLFQLERLCNRLEERYLGEIKVMEIATKN